MAPESRTAGTGWSVRGSAGCRIMLVAPQSFFSVSGTPISVLCMCRALTELGYEVHLVTFPFGENIAMPGLHYHRLPRIPFIKRVPIGFSVRKGICDVLLALKAVHLLRHHRFLAVHAVEEAAFFAVPLARLFGVSAITDVDSDIYQQLRGHRSVVARCLARAAASLRRVALRQSTCAVTVAAPLTEIVAQVSPGTQVFQIGDVPVDSVLSSAKSQADETARRELGLEASRAVVYTGNFDERQGVDTLLRAMPGIRAQVADAALLLVGGEVEEIARMRQLAASLGVSHAVRFAGKRAPDLMPGIMRLAEVLVSPRREPLITPLKIYSYMASGRPVVATDLPTHRCVLDDDSAFLVPPTADGLASGVVEALQNRTAAWRRGRRARSLVEQRHTFGHFKRHLAEAYEYVERRANSGM